MVLHDFRSPCRGLVFVSNDPVVGTRLRRANLRLSLRDVEAVTIPTMGFLVIETPDPQTRKRKPNLYLFGDGRPLVSWQSAIMLRLL
jgi:hypothetical protein